jgi:hypothetical protein
VLRIALGLGALCAIAGCTAPAGPAREAADPPRAENPTPASAEPGADADALER